jgi:hypothetical protein
VRRPGRLALLCLLVFSLLSLKGVLAPPAAFAQRPKLELKDVALRATDLPGDFAVSKEETRPMDPGPGTLYSALMERPITNETVTTGPVMVGQFIGRFDSAVGYDGFLDEIRRRAIEQDGFEQVPGAPNDGGTASLQKFEGQVASYEVGFIKRDMVIFTRWVGHRDYVSLQGLLTLAGVTSARYDQLLAGPASAPNTDQAAAPPQPESTAPVPAPAPAPPSKAGRIANTGGTGANLRALPHATSDLIQVVDDGESVSLIGVPESGADGRQWHNIKTTSGAVGWVVAEYVAAGDASPVAAAAPTARPAVAAAPPPPAPTATRTPPRPTATPVPPTPVPKPASAIDNRIMPALRTLYGMKTKPPSASMSMGELFQAIVSESVVSIIVKQLPQNEGGNYYGRTNTITMNAQLLNEDTRTIASILAHELTHVRQALRGDDPSRGCVESEVEAFKVGLLTWAILYDGPAPGRTQRERNNNFMTARWLTEGDPWLYKAVVDTDGYQDECKLWVP